MEQLFVRAHPVSQMRVLIAILLPIATGVVQWEMWEYIKPLAWFLFYPTIFFAPMIGGLLGGIGATVISSLLVWYIFIPPQFSFQIVQASTIFSVIIFCIMGVVFCIFHDRFYKTNRATAVRAMLEESEKFITLIAEHLPGIAGYWDCNERCKYSNRHYLEWFGKSRKQMRGITIRELLGAKVYAMNEPYIRAALRGECQTFERSLANENGDIRYTIVQYFPHLVGNNIVMGFITLATDITMAKLAEQKMGLLNDALLQLARVDGLTGATNRRHFDELLESEWLRAERSKLPIGLLMIDIDHFKFFNDNNGHLAGDGCIRSVVETIKSIVRNPPDAVARYGGEEFVCLLPGADIVAVSEVGQRVLDAMRDRKLPHGFSSVSEYLTISIGGTSLVPVEANKSNDLIDAADRNLYRAKNSGRNNLITDSNHSQELEICQSYQI